MGVNDSTCDAWSFAFCEAPIERCRTRRRRLRTQPIQCPWGVWPSANTDPTAHFYIGPASVFGEESVAIFDRDESSTSDVDPNEVLAGVNQNGVTRSLDVDPSRGFRDGENQIKMVFVPLWNSLSYPQDRIDLLPDLNFFVKIYRLFRHTKLTVTCRPQIGASSTLAKCWLIGKSPVADP